jgi:hypothetical protein
MAIRDMVARNSSYKDTMDLFPTPPWATRALYEYVAPELKALAPTTTAWDPAAGLGHMVKVFEEYGHPVARGTDIVARPGIEVGVQDFIQSHDTAGLIVTNPPYALALAFALKGLERASTGLAMLMRIQFLESQGRYHELFSKTPPTKVAVFSDRIPFRKDIVVRKAPKMWTHCWVYWDIKTLGSGPETKVIWVPPNAQKLLEKDSDYA